MKEGKVQMSATRSPSGDQESPLLPENHDMFPKPFGMSPQPLASPLSAADTFWNPTQSWKKALDTAQSSHAEIALQWGGLFLMHPVSVQRVYLSGSLATWRWSCHAPVFGVFHSVEGGYRRSLSAVWPTLSLVRNATLQESEFCSCSIQEGWRNLSCQEVCWLII